jgi:hypothetical protein
MGDLTNQLVTGTSKSRKADRTLRVSFEFEEGSPYRHGVIESLSRSLQATAQHSPFMMSSYPFFEATKAADWFSGKSLFPANGVIDSEPANKNQRLRAIKCGSDTLLEHSYAPDGRVATTQYFDGEVIFYEHDDISRISHIRSKSGRIIEVKLRGDDLPEYFSYDGGNRFYYEYGQNAYLTRLVYPDGMQMERTFGHHVQPESVRCGPMFVKLCWNDSNELESYTVEDGSRSFDFHSNARQHQYDLALTPNGPALSSFPVVHPFGAWRMNEQNVLEEMLTPWGERFRAVAVGQNGPDVVWSSSGQQSFNYNEAGNLASTIRPDGARLAVYLLKGQNRALFVGPSSITLLHLDQAGRVRKTLGNNGNYSLIDYASDGSLKRIATFIETISVCRGGANSSCSIRSDSGYSCKLAHSIDGSGTRLITEGLHRNTSSDLPRMLKFLWQLLGLRANYHLP